MNGALLRVILGDQPLTRVRIFGGRADGVFKF